MPLATRMRMAAAGATVDAGDALATAMLALSPVELWIMGELSGTTAAASVLTPTRDGTFANVTLDNVDGPGGFSRAGLWNGTTSTCDIYSASLASAFNGSVGTALIFAKISGAQWGDSTLRNLLYLAVDSSNFVRLLKTAITNRIIIRYKASDTTQTVTYDSTGPTGWVLWGVTWTTIGNEMKAYFLPSSAGGQIGTTQVGLTAWVGTLNSDTTVIGSASVSSPSVVMSGNLGYCAIYDTVLTEAQIQAVMAATE